MAQRNMAEPPMLLENLVLPAQQIKWTADIKLQPARITSVRDATKDLTGNAAHANLPKLSPHTYDATTRVSMVLEIYNGGGLVMQLPKGDYETLRTIQNLDNSLESPVETALTAVLEGNRIRGVIPAYH